MDYAVIKTGGKQYRVTPGDVIDVEKTAAEAGSTIELTDVLLVSQNGAVTVGAPFIPDAKVVSEVQQHGRGKKVVVFKFKSKTRQRTKTGHRQSYTRLQVTEILVGKAPSKEAAATPKATPAPKTARPRRSRATKKETSDGS